MIESLYVPTRYCGPVRSGNGGFVAGSLAAGLGDTTGRPVTVTLRQPPPLEVTMRVNQEGSGVTLTFGGALVAQAEPGGQDVTPVEGVGWDEAVAASPSYPGHRSHPFPHCFVCGPEREDGLRIFPGLVPPVRGDTRLAAPWIPDRSIAAQVPDQHQDDSTPRASLAATWAALDCIGGWAGDITERLMVLGRMTAVVDTLPVLGEEHVVMGERRGSEGRKTFTASTLHDADGRIVGRAEHVWIAVDPATFAG